MSDTNFKIHPEVKKVIMRKHIAAVSTGLASSIISLIIAIVLFELKRTGHEIAKWEEDLVDAADCVISTLMFASCAFLLFNKKGFEIESHGSKRVFTSTLIVFSDFTLSFIISMVMAFSGMDTSQLVMWFMISFGISITLLLISEFVLFQVSVNQAAKVYGDVDEASITSSSVGA